MPLRTRTMALGAALDGIAHLGRLSYLLWLPWLPIIAACATSDPQAAFDPVAASLAERTQLELPADLADAPLLPEPLDADGAARFALAADPELRADLEDLGVAQADYAQATRLANPTLFGSRLGSSNGDGHQTTASVAIDILDWIVQPLRRRHAELELEATKLRVGQRLLDEVAEARRAFYEAQAAHQIAARLERVRELDAASLELAERLAEAGNLSALDVAEHRAQLHSTDAEVGRARLAAIRAGEHLRRAIGVPNDHPAPRFAESLPEPAAGEPALDGLESRAAETRLDLGAARVAVDAVGRALSLRRGTRFSPLGIDVGVEREEEVDGTRLTGPTLAIRLPLFDLGGASVARLEAEQRRVGFQLAAATLEATSQVRESHAALLAARRELDLYRESILPERARILDQTLRRYNMMLAGVYEVLAAKRAEIEAEKATVEAWKEYWLARVELWRAAGGGELE